MITEDIRLGPLLRARRETLGLSLEDVEAAIRIRAQYLLALEADEWQRLPGEVVGRGFLHNYAEFLKLDGDELKRHRHSETLARLSQEWPNTSAGTQMPAPRDMDYRPLEAQQAGEFSLAGQGSSGAWRRFLVTVLLLTAIGLVTVAFLTDLYPEFPTRTTLMGLQANATGWLQGTLSRLDMASRSLVSAPQNEEADPDIENVQIVEVAPPTPTLLPTPTFLPTPTLPPAAVNTPLPDPTQVPTENEAPAPEPTPLPEAEGLAQAECNAEGMQFTSPLEGQTIGGLVQLIGTAAVPDQWYYKLEYRIVAEAGQAQRQAFTYFDGYITTVTNGLLGELNTVSLATGTYALRLTVVLREQAEPLVCEMTVRVQN